MKSDLIDESDQELLRNGYKIKKVGKNIEVGTLSVSHDEQVKQLKREKGEYVIINSRFVHLLGKDCEEQTQKTLEKYLKKFVTNKKNVLVVGLGNPHLISDALGTKVIEKINIIGTERQRVSAISPDVFGNTGIRTSIIIEAICNKIKPTLVIIVDSLGTYSEDRLATSFQISTAGIVPGGALDAENSLINSASLKVPCVVLGVPLMLVVEKPISPLTEVLCPKNIEEYVETCSIIISNAINSVLHKTSAII